MTDVIVNLIHKPMSEKECLENVKKMHKEHPDLILSPRAYMKLKKKYDKERKEMGL